MTAKEKALVEEWKKVLASGDDAKAEALLKKYPGLANYDGKGNWIGNVAGENGWTQ